jgi:hypothetical protein
MPRPRIALTFVVWLGLLASSVVHGCSGADEPPDNSFTGGKGGAAGSGGFVGIDVTTDAPSACTDPTDSDGDGIADELEGTGDSDGDGIPDFLDLDSDGDGLPDADEAENPLLPAGEPGQSRSGPCSPVADTDGDGIPDFQDLDSDGDGLPDAEEVASCGAHAACAVLADCDGDGVIDIVELAAGSSPCDKNDVAADAGLYFVVPYQLPEQSKKFDFSTGIKEADIYFLLDTTQSMQPAIDDIKLSLDTRIIPTILNGDATTVPPIPAVPGAWIGIGDFKDVPWASWGVPGDHVYRHRYTVNLATVTGNVSAPVASGASFKAPENVKQILETLTASGGGDAPESTTQALWLSATQEAYQVGGGGFWPAPAADCDSPQKLGRACFRPGKLPVFVIVTDAGFHNGPTAAFDYLAPPAGNVTGTRAYKEVVDKLAQIGAKIVGVSVNTGTAGQARTDLIDLAKQTGSEYFDPAFGGSIKQLVTSKDIAPNKDTGELSKEVVRLIGTLVGQGLNNVTTKTTSYDCAGGIDCNGDGSLDPEYHNPLDPLTQQPFDAASLVTRVVPVPVATEPKPYTSIDTTTFYGVRGDATVEFEVFARNDVLNPKKLTVIRALLRVQTPGGQALGGADGVKIVYLVIPPYAAVPR